MLPPASSLRGCGYVPLNSALCEGSLDRPALTNEAIEVQCAECGRWYEMSSTVYGPVKHRADGIEITWWRRRLKRREK